MKKALSVLVEGNKNWIGGLYYKRNIIFSLLQNEEIRKKYRIIVFAKKEIFDWLKPLGNDFVLLDSKWYMSPKRFSFISKLLNIKFDFVGNPNEDRLIYSPKLIYWIPDFQHNYYPNYFTKKELDDRNKKYSMVAKSDSPVIFSSNSAERDFLTFYCDKKRDNTYVVPFVSYIEPELSELNDTYVNSVIEKYKLSDKRLVCISNQFWQHKNHIIVFEAIKQLVGRGLSNDVKFVFTGEIKDNRNSEYYQKLLNFVKDDEVADRICITGFIDREEQLAIMKASEFVLQPSLFEGWGTVVEDAKVLGKKILLSDIPVHREQMNENCVLFDPHNSRELADKILNELEINHFDDQNASVADMYRRAKEYSASFCRMLNENG
ncbi:MAG: glycosyltransferase family 4 protein [Acutalibacteraceae bacterium]